MSVRLVNDEYFAELERERAPERALEKLKADRKRKIHEAYLKLPCPVDFPECYEYRIPIPHEFDASVLNWHQQEPITVTIDEYYTFVKLRGRWVMTENEMNRHVYKGIYI